MGFAVLMMFMKFVYFLAESGVINLFNGLHQPIEQSQSRLGNVSIVADKHRERCVYTVIER